MNKGRATKDTKASDRTGRMREETAEYRQHIVTGKARLKRFRENWETVTLGDIVDIRNGGTPRTEVPAYWGGVIPWCIPTDITACRGRYLVTTKRRITPEGLASCGTTLLPLGALLLCSRATIGEVKIASIPVATNQGFKSMVCVRRGKAVPPSRCESCPAKGRSSRKQSERFMEVTTWIEALRCQRAVLDGSASAQAVT